MKKTDFKKLALLGMAGGMILAAQAPVYAHETSDTTVAHQGCGACGGRKANNKQQSYGNYTADVDTKSGKQLTESELLPQLNTEGRALYNGLDADGKAHALKLASQDRYANNKNEAVKEAAKRQADRRSGMNR